MLQTQLNYSSFFFILIFPFFCFSFDFNLSEIEKDFFVHFGVQEDSNKKNKGDIANLGFIIGKKSVLVIDTGGTIEIANKLIEKIKNKTNLPISHVVITHGHPDHFLGSSAFSVFNPIFIGHENLERSLTMNFNFYKLLQSTSIEDRSILDIKPVIPNLKVKKKSSILIDLGSRKIEIKAWESGHTDNDLSVYDIKTKVFWSENIFIQRVPSIRASILGWKENLQQTKKIKISKIVPGHGPVRTKENAIKPMLEYFDRIINEVRKLHKSGKDIEFAQNNAAKENKENWLLYKHYHKSNVTKAYSELEWE